MVVAVKARAYVIELKPYAKYMMEVCPLRGLATTGKLPDAALFATEAAAIKEVNLLQPHCKSDAVLTPRAVTMEIEDE